MAISRKELLELVKLYKSIQHEIGFINPDKKELLGTATDIIENLKIEITLFGKRNCKNFDSVRFQEAIQKAELENEEDHEAIQKTVEHVQERNKINHKTAIKNAMSKPVVSLDDIEKEEKYYEERLKEEEKEEHQKIKEDAIYDMKREEEDKPKRKFSDNKYASFKFGLE